MKSRILRFEIIISHEGIYETQENLNVRFVPVHVIVGAFEAYKVEIRLKVKSEDVSGRSIS
jgi:hypothetical protein